jgi:outer membrane protein assembly factor BamB
MRRALLLALAIVGLSRADDVQGAAWPQYRSDANRSAASSEQLPATLHLQWVRYLPVPRPAFPGEVRLWFDASYDPVVLGRTMFVPSMVTDSVTALDTQTGAQQWQFFAEGPVRFAPVAWEGSVYFISDDGHLYCVGAADGKLRWKFRGLPPGKTDRKLLGSGRLISLFPARGGPVLRDGVIYFGAGLWSKYGVAIHALDARSGRVIWSNTDSNHIPKANMDHGVAHEAGLTPQGYLAIVNETLVIPCGAQLPAFLDLKTGKLQTFCMGWGGRNGLPKGTWFVAGDRNYLGHGGDLYDITRPNDEQFDDPRMRTDFKSMLYAGGFTRVRIDPTNHKDLGAFREPVFAEGVMYDNDRGVVALSLSDVKLEERKKTAIPPERRTDTYPDKWKMTSREVWRLPSKLRVHIKAGQHLYLGGAGAVEAVCVPQGGGTPEVVWQGKVGGTPHRMLAADGKLFVVTREGAIYAYGAQKKEEPIKHLGLFSAIFLNSDTWDKTAADLLQTTQVREGYAVVLGIETGRLVEELVKQSSLHVIVVERDAEKAARLRRRLHAAGLYGTRGSVHVGDPLSYPLPPYMASLVVSENWAEVGVTRGGQFVAAVVHLLRPYGGTACLALPPAERDALAKEIADGKIAGVTARAQGDSRLLVSRTGPLPGSADWSHAEADAANTGASEEQFAKAPLDLLWFDTPPRWVRTPGATLVRVCGGRMFIKAERLQVFDVYTGRRLWETSLPFPHRVTDQMVALDDAVYVTGGQSCDVLDPVTGRKTGQIDLPPGLTGVLSNLIVWQDYLVAQSGKHLVCFNRRTGNLVWKEQFGQAKLSVAVGNGKVFCAELPLPKQQAKTASRESRVESPELECSLSTLDPPPSTPHARAFDLQTGKRLWEIPGGSEVRYSRKHDLVVMTSGIYRASDGSLVAALPDFAKAEPKTKPENLPRPLFVIGDKLLVGAEERYVEYDLQTGKPAGKAMTWIRRGCTTPRASSNLLTTRVRGNAACIDLASREIISFWNVRAACSNNLFPACGVVNMPSLTGGCTCNYVPVSQAYAPAGVIQRVGPGTGAQ